MNLSKCLQNKKSEQRMNEWDRWISIESKILVLSLLQIEEDVLLGFDDLF